MDKEFNEKLQTVFFLNEPPPPPGPSNVREEVTVVDRINHT